MTDNEAHIKKASELIKAFSTEKEPERLREAALELEDVDLRRVYDVAKRERIRSEALELWLTIIQTIDKNLDPEFDPNEVLPLKIAPPPLKDGTQLPPGASPDTIADPKAREDYKKAVNENREKQEKYLVQSQLYELNDPLTGRTEAFLRRDFAENDKDRNVIRQAVERLITSDERKEKLLKFIEPRSD